MKRALPVLVSLMVICGQLCAQHQKSYENISALALTLEKLDVVIVKSTGDKVNVKVSDDDYSGMEISVHEGILQIRQTVEPGFFSKSRQLTCEVPDDLEMKIRMDAGTLAINHIAGTFQVSTHHGDILASVSLRGHSYFDSESGKVTIRLEDSLQANLTLNAGSGQGTLDLDGHPISAKLKMQSFYPSGTIKAPFEFKEVHITKTYGPDTIIKGINFGESNREVSLSTGGGTIRIIQ